jgi:hypothetical protein
MTNAEEKRREQTISDEDAPGDKENHEKITHDNVRHVSKENDR